MLNKRNNAFEIILNFFVLCRMTKLKLKKYCETRINYKFNLLMFAIIKIVYLKINIVDK